MKCRTVSLVVTPLVLLCLGSSGWADGGFFRPRESPADIYEPEQKAFIWYKDGVEDLVLQASYQGAVSDFAWVVPVPAQPEVDKVDGALFHELSRLTAVREYHRGMLGGNMIGRAESAGVAVLERKQVGHYDVSVLAATDANALANWLNANGYAMPEGAEQVLNHYVERAWYYVAMRIAAGSEAVGQKLRSGLIEPLRLTFSTEQIVYPFRITALNPGGTEVLLYVAAPDPVRAGGLHEEFCARVRAAEVSAMSYPTLAGLVSGAFALTKLRGHFAQSEIHDDITITQRGGRVKPLAEVQNPPPPLRVRLRPIIAEPAWTVRRWFAPVNMADAPSLVLSLWLVGISAFSVLVVKAGGGLCRRLWRAAQRRA